MGNTTATPKKSKHNSNNNDDDDDDQQRQQEQPGPNERNRQSSDPPPRATSSPPRSPDWSRTSSIDSGSSSRRRSVSSADGLKAARDLNESDGFDPNDPLGGFDADEALASENVEHPEQWEPHRLEELRAALRKKIQSLGPEDAVSVKSLRLEQVSGRWAFSRSQSSIRCLRLAIHPFMFRPLTLFLCLVPALLTSG